MSVHAMAHNVLQSRTKVHLLLAFLLVVATAVAYWQVLVSDFVLYDDDVYVMRNPIVQEGLTLSGIRWALGTKFNANWHPLTWMSHMAVCQLFGLNASSHHAVNLLLHVLSTLLLFSVLRRMTRSDYRSAFVAALFAIHPLHVESVAWVSERKDVLSTFFWFLTMWAYVRYVESPSVRRQMIVIAAYALGIMAKPMLVTLPFVLLLLDYWPLRRLGKKATKAADKQTTVFDLVWEKVPLFGIAAMSCVMTYQAQQIGGAVASKDLLPLSIRLANALVAYIAYITKTIWPAKLAVFYPHPVDTLPHWQVAGSAILLTVISVAVVFVAKNRPYLTVGWLWYVGTLVPVIGLVQVGEQAMADRYTYIPLVGLFIAVTWAIGDLLTVTVDPNTNAASDSSRIRRSVRLATVVVGVGIIAALMVRTWIQVGYWRNSLSLFAHAVEVTENNYAMHAKLGMALAAENRTDEAIAEYRKAIRARPDFGIAHHNLAVLLYETGQYAEAWKEVHLAEASGTRVHPQLIERLAEQMPEPTR